MAVVLMGFGQAEEGGLIIRRVVSVTLVGAVLVSGAPTMAQSLSRTVATAESRAILASAERLTAEAALEQDETFVRRRRSGALAAAGAVLAATGAVLVMQPPVCSLEGSAHQREDLFSGDYLDLNYEAVLKSGSCDLRLVASGQIFGDHWDFVEYQSDAHLITYSEDFGDRRAVTNRTRNHVGLAAIAAGGALLWFGLRQVDVPFRVDLGMNGGLSVSRSFGW